MHVVGEDEDTVWRSLRRLSDLGLVTSEDESSIQVAPDGPDLVFEILRTQIEHEYLDRRRAAADLRHDLTRILGEGLLSEAPGGSPPIEELPTAEATQVRLLELAGHARQEVLGMWTRMPETTSPAAGAEQVVVDRAVRRGIGVRMICPTASARQGLAQRLVAVDGAALRTVVNPPLELHVFDRRVAVVVTNAPHQATAVSFMVRGQPLTHVLHCLFETWWRHGQDASAGTDGTLTEVTGEDQVLLQLLADGVKDENAARQLGCSVRTVRRKVSALLDKLDSVSRFQAGVYAARRRWV